MRQSTTRPQIRLTWQLNSTKSPKPTWSKSPEWCSNVVKLMNSLITSTAKRKKSFILGSANTMNQLETFKKLTGITKKANQLLTGWDFTCPKTSFKSRSRSATLKASLKHAFCSQGTWKRTECSAKQFIFMPRLSTTLRQWKLQSPTASMDKSWVSVWPLRKKLLQDLQAILSERGSSKKLSDFTRRLESLRKPTP